MSDPETMIDPGAESLLGRAAAEPAAVMSAGWAVLESVDDPDSRAVVLRAMSIAARNAATLEESVDLAQRGAEIARDPTVRRECLLTMAGSLGNAGDISRALDVIASAEEGAHGLIAAQLEFQRAVLNTVRGDYEAAITGYDHVLPGFEAAGREDFVAMVLHNLGFILTQLGRLDEAEAALLRAREIEASGGREMEVAGSDHNLGILASYRGDIPEALRRLTLSDETHMRNSNDNVPRHVSRCEVLLSAGMHHEALALARRIAAGARRRGRFEDEADALLVAARAASLAGDPAEASRLAGLAASLFSEQRRQVWVSHAHLALAEAQHEADGPSEEVADAARRTAAELDAAGFIVGAARARLLAGTIALELGDSSSAERDLGAVTASRTGPVELRLQRWEAQAMLRLDRGDLRGADAAARAGLDLLDEYQAGLGASDLRLGIERQGDRLGRIGLRLAVGSGEPGRVLRWLERTRARALRLRPVVPLADEGDGAVLAELRWVSAELRKPELTGDRDLLRRQRRLQEELRGTSRGRHAATPEGEPARFDVGSLVDVVGEGCVVEIGVSDEEMIAVVVRSRGLRFHRIGHARPVLDQLRRLRSDLRRAARMGRNPALAATALGRFDQDLLGRLDIDAGPVVLIPPGPLLAAPWASMPSLLDSTLTVAPSAEMWWRARRRSSGGSGVVLASGPDLAHAGSEVESLRQIYPDASVFGPSDPTDDLARAVRGSSVTHMACHASFEADNPMFSSLRLGDGDFNVYDLERIGSPPALMVLSACDSGYTETRAGDELTGLTSALLSMGSRNVVASVGLVPDDPATAELMVQFHRAVSSGVPPAEALARAQRLLRAEPDGYLAAASFLCIGG